MQFLDTLKAEVALVPAEIQHGALWLVGAAAAARKKLAEMEADDPLIATAIKIGEAAAVAHGLPLTEIENAGAQLLAAATAIATHGGS